MILFLLLLIGSDYVFNSIIELMGARVVIIVGNDSLLSRWTFLLPLYTEVSFAASWPIC